MLFDAKLEHVIRRLDSTGIAIETDCPVDATENLPERLLNWLACWTNSSDEELAIPIHKSLPVIEQVNIRGLVAERLGELSNHWSSEEIESRSSILGKARMLIDVSDSKVLVRVVPCRIESSPTDSKGKFYLAYWDSELELATSLKSELVSRSFSVFQREKRSDWGGGVVNGAAYMDNLEEEIQNSDYVAGILTDTSNGSRWFEFEIRKAEEYSKEIFLWQPKGEVIGRTSDIDSPIMKSKASILEVPISDN